MDVGVNSTKEVLTRLGLDGLARECLKIAKPPLRKCQRSFGRLDRKLIEDYLARHEIRKLHLGSGEHVLDGWLNSDHLPGVRSTLQLDATKRFPFEDGQFDYIFSEHMIEHITYPQGSRMLAECHRVLRDGGTARISTPNLAFLWDLYRADKTEFHEKYIRWELDTFIPTAPYPEDTFVINNFVRAWGHQFIYDEKTLSRSMRDAGFTKITRCELGASDHESLRNLENEHRLPDGYLRYQTFTLEATKSATG